MMIASDSNSLAMWNNFNAHLYNTSLERIGYIISKCYFWRLSKHGGNLLFTVPIKPNFRVYLVYYVS